MAKNKNKYKKIIKNTGNDAESYVAMYWILGDLNNGHVNIFSGNQFKWLHQLYHETFYNYKDPDKLELLTVLVDPKVRNRYKWDEYEEVFGKSFEELEIDWINYLKENIKDIELLL